VLKSAPRLHALLSDGVVELNGTSLAVPEASRILLRGVARRCPSRCVQAIT
jgi:oxygen-independent coproporphyrinogen-3 oxidase